MPNPIKAQTTTQTEQRRLTQKCARLYFTLLEEALVFIEKI